MPSRLARSQRRLKRIPSPLAALLVVALVQGLAWIVVTPALQTPDEDSHFAYTQKIVEDGVVPWTRISGPVSGSASSTEMGYASLWAGLGPLARNPEARPLWTEADERLWREQDRGLPPSARADGGSTTASANPPLYYLYQGVPYAIASGGSFFDRQYAMRLANIPLLLVTVAATWFLVAELIPRPLWPRAFAAGLVTVQPLLLNLTGSVNPDILITALWTLALYVMVLLLRRGPSRGRFVALALLCAAAALTHGRALAILAPAALTVGLTLVRARRGTIPKIAWRATAASLGVLVLASVVAATRPAGATVGEYFSYLWQFYLPKLPFQEPQIGTIHWGVERVFVERFFGVFAQLEVTFPPRLIDAIGLFCLLGLAALVVTAVIRRQDLRRNADVAAVLGTAFFAAMLLLHVVAYRSLVKDPSDPIITGRYLLPLISLYGLLAVLALSALPRRVAPVVACVVLMAASIVQLAGLGLVTARFYA